MLRKVLMVVFALVLLVLLAGGIGAWVTFAPNTPAYEGERSVKIPPDAELEAVMDSLAANGILASRRTFRWVARLTGWHQQIKAGHYAFESGQSNYDLLDVLRKGLQTPIHVTIPPGSRPEVVASVAARDMAFSADAFLQALRDSTLATELDTDTTHLFGYLLPETYFFYWLSDPHDVVRRAKHTFDEFFTEEVRHKTDSLGLTPDEVITLASIVEWETSRRTEKPRIAGVYLNRIRRGMALQADPTVQYAVLQEEGSKRRLLFEDYEIDHPYNTYAYPGLPPGPVTNPSRSSIRAVVNAEDHDYLFFVANVDGGHTFSSTFEEHVRAANRFRREMRRRRAQR